VSPLRYLHPVSLQPIWGAGLEDKSEVEADEW